MQDFCEDSSYQTHKIGKLSIKLEQENFEKIFAETR